LQRKLLANPNMALSSGNFVWISVTCVTDGAGHPTGGRAARKLPGKFIVQKARASEAT
jgi:hypothetical protein